MEVNLNPITGGGWELAHTCSFFCFLQKTVGARHLGTFQVHSFVTLCKTFEVLDCARASPGPVSRGTFRPLSTFLTFADKDPVPEVHINEQ